MTQADPDFAMSMMAGNAGAAPVGALAPVESKDGKGPPLQIIVGAQKPQELYAYIRGLTPDDLSYQLEAFDRGMLRGVVPMWRKMCERDGHLLSVTEKRLGRTAALEWKVIPQDDSPEADKQAEFLKAFIESIPEFADRIEHLFEAIKYSIAGCEIEWLPTGGPDGKLGCRLWPQNHEDWDLTARGRRGKPRIYVNSQSTELPPDKFVIHHLKISMMVASSILYVMKMLTAGQWLAFGEKFGMPGIFGNAPASASADDVAKFYNMLCDWAQEFVAVAREGYTVTTQPAGGANGTLTYPQLVEWADKENSKIWTGHTVTSEGESGSGTLAGNSAQDQLDDLVMADGARLARSIEKCLCEPAIRFQFGQPLLVNFVLVTEKPMTPDDKKLEAETDAKLVNEVGLPLPLRDLYEKYGWRKPEAGEETTQRRDAAMPGNGSAGGLTDALKIAGPAATISDAAIAPAREALAAMLEPLSKLIQNAGGMSEEDLRAAVVKLELPAEGFVDALAPYLQRAVEAGSEKAGEGKRETRNAKHQTGGGA